MSVKSNKRKLFMPTGIYFLAGMLVITCIMYQQSKVFYKVKLLECFLYHDSNDVVAFDDAGVYSAECNWNKAKDFYINNPNKKFIKIDLKNI